MYVYVYVYVLVKTEGGISVILRGYLGYFRGVSRLLPFLRALCYKARRPVLRPNTINTVKWYMPPLVLAAIPSYNEPVGKSPPELRGIIVQGLQQPEPPSSYRPDRGVGVLNLIGGGLEYDRDSGDFLPLIHITSKSLREEGAGGNAYRETKKGCSYAL